MMEYHKRGFLNKARGTAVFECSVDHGPAEESFYNSVCANFCITDCARKIELDFYAHDKESEVNCLHKIDTLITELQSFKANLLEAYAAADFKEKE
jgi:hypothetical protein